MHLRTNAYNFQTQALEFLLSCLFTCFLRPATYRFLLTKIKGGLTARKEIVVLD